MHRHIDMGDMCEATQDGKHWEVVKYLFYDAHNDEYVCLVDNTYCKSYMEIRELIDEL
jgi:hypothetical protein